MSLRLHALAFMKEKKVKYYIHNDVIFFSCFHCGNKTEMNAHTTEWGCHCGNKGNLGSLIRLDKKELEVSPDKTFINPKKEKYDINFLLNKLSEQSQCDRKALQLIQEKFKRFCKEFGI